MTQRPDDRVLDDQIERVERLRFVSGGVEREHDHVAREEPLEIRIEDTPLAVVMRTPGHDIELATGFLITERIVTRADEIASIHHCTLGGEPESAENVVRVSLAPGIRVDWEAMQRRLYASSSCGVCGKATIAQALAHAPAREDPARFAATRFRALPHALRDGQPAFDRTGGLHGVALFGRAARPIVVREDVGRHNAVDKVIGWATRAGRLPLQGHILMVSGRISYEIVQKALAARLPVIAAVSAPSSLAVALAREAGMALVAFLRDDGLNVYGSTERIVG